MKEILTVREFAKVRYGTDEPTKAQENCVRQMCANGSIAHADKVGRTWLINARKEMPNCYA